MHRGKRKYRRVCCNTANPRAITQVAQALPAARAGIAILMVLAVVAITLALVFALSHASSTAFCLTANETNTLRARTVAASAAARALENFAADPNWMPESNPISGLISPDEPYRLDVQLSDHGSARRIDAVGQILDPDDSRTVAHRLLSIKLARQMRNNYPRSAITALAATSSSLDGPPVYVANGTTIRGDIRSKGPIHFQIGFVLDGQTYVLSDIATSGTGPSGYGTYRSAWGAEYTAEKLASFGTVSQFGELRLSNVSLSPNETNPMGVYIHEGDVVLHDNVIITGTLVVSGDLRIEGTKVHLLTLQQATDPADNSSIKTSFPVLVVGGSIRFGWGTDWVRISGLVLASHKVTRVTDLDLLNDPICTHNHLLDIGTNPDPFGSSDGPAIYIKGAIMADRVSLGTRTDRPLALVFDGSRTDVTDAPGFFTWRSTEWHESN